MYVLIVLLYYAKEAIQMTADGYGTWPEVYSRQFDSKHYFLHYSKYTRCIQSKSSLGDYYTAIEALIVLGKQD